MHLRLAAIAAFALAVVPAVLAQQPQQRSAPAKPAAGLAQFPNLACVDPFVKGSSHKRMEEVFGRANVTFEEVSGPEGTIEQATVIFGKDSKKRLEVNWADGEGKQGLMVVQIKNESAWVGPKGLKVGATLAEVEKMNGGPFRIGGFYWDLGGYAVLRSGGFKTTPDGCHVNLRFSPTVELPEKQAAQISGDKQISSSHAAMKAAKPTVSEVSIGYRFE